MESEPERELAIFAPIDRNPFQRRFGLVMLPSLVFMSGPSLYPGRAYWEINITQDLRWLIGSSSTVIPVQCYYEIELTREVG